ncbi:MAG TPA: lysophospholipid acyltransferase family protein [Burkholderiaceae bacterium]|nr:lysophospholipid acyltransferase family protein [Burkholderiaceae bacterium]
MNDDATTTLAGRRGLEADDEPPRIRRGHRLRAVVRIVHAVVHALHGIAIVLLRFKTMDAARRHALIQWWARKMLRVMGIELRVDGTAAGGEQIAPGTLLVANHISWLDIMVVHAVCPQARFVSKADVRHWPLVSRLADAANTLYLERERKRDALRVVHLVAAALKNDEIVAVFPEGTTSDGRDVLPFHANLLQAAISTGAPVQPIALRFSDTAAAVSPAVEYIGTTTLVQSVWRVASGDGVCANVVLLAPRSGAQAERRELAQALRADIAALLRLPR